MARIGDTRTHCEEPHGIWRYERQMRVSGGDADDWTVLTSMLRWLPLP